MALAHLIVLTVAFLATHAHCPTEQVPKSVKYAIAGYTIYSTGVVTNNSWLLVQDGKLNWKIQIDKKIEDVKTWILVRRGRDLVYATRGSVPYCNGLPEKAESYLKLLGFDEATPASNDCPYKPGTYRLKNYQPDPSQLKGITKGYLTIEFHFYVREKPNDYFKMDVWVD